MNTLPEEIQDMIYKYKHQMEFSKVVREFKIFQMRDETFHLSQYLLNSILECGPLEHEDILLALKQNLRRLGTLGWDENDSDGLKRIYNILMDDIGTAQKLANWAQDEVNRRESILI